MGRNVNEVLNDVGLGPYHFVQLLLIGGVMISDGAEILVSSSLLTALKSIWDLTPMVRGLMMSTIFVGVFIGGLIGGQIGDVYGRRKAILISYCGIVCFGLATAAAQGPISMLILRFFFGAAFGCGMGPGVAMQVETAPTNWRSHIINLGGLWFTIGEVYTSVLLIMFMPDLTDNDGTHWRWVTLLSMVPGFLLFPFTYFLLQESPHFLVAQGRREEAVHALHYIATMNHQVDKLEGLDGTDPDQRLHIPTGGEAAAALEDTEEGEQGASASLLESAGSSKDTRRTSTSSTQSARSIDLALQEERAVKKVTMKESLGLLFSPDYRSIVIGGAYLCFLANFLFYGFTYALPQIFAKIGKDLEPAVQVLIISICDLPGVLLAFFLLYAKTIGHRDGLAILAGCAAVLSLTLISIDHGEEGLYIGLPSAYLVKYVSSAFFTLSYVYLSEVFPSKIRASGLSLCIAFGRVGSILSPIIVESLHIKGFKWGEHSPFMILTSMLALLGIVMIKGCLYFELKNQALQDSAPPRGESAASSSKDERRNSKTPVDPETPAPAG